MSFSLLSKIESRGEVRNYLEWHCQQRVPVQLMFCANEGHLSAYVVGFDDETGTVDVVCIGARDLESRAKMSYAVIGSTASGGKFLASGVMSVDSEESDSFKLSFPQWLDVSQSRDCYRCNAPADHFLHFSSLDPHLNDIIFRVKNVSFGGLAVECERNADLLAFSEDTQTHDAILQSRSNQLQLGKLRVAHITYSQSRCIIGLNFAQGVPKGFDSLVLDVQRTQHLR